MTERRIDWDGFHNARDLGGLPTTDGGTTRRGQLIRSALLQFVTQDGWRAAYDAGVRTIVDLRNPQEVVDVVMPDNGFTWVNVELDGVEDVEFWKYLQQQLLDGTPLYFGPFLRRKPDRVAAAITAIARAGDGGVLFHCGAGRDRTGLVTLLLLSLVGVDADTIGADYDLSAAALPTLFAAAGRPGDLDEVMAALAHHRVSTRDAIHALLDEFDAEDYLRSAGVSETDLQAVRARLRE
jgi:protein-tyrosine phosphatase